MQADFSSHGDPFAHTLYLDSGLKDPTLSRLHLRPAPDQTRKAEPPKFCDFSAWWEPGVLSLGRRGRECNRPHPRRPVPGGSSKHTHTHTHTRMPSRSDSLYRFPTGPGFLSVHTRLPRKARGKETQAQASLLSACPEIMYKNSTTPAAKLMFLEVEKKL